MSSWVPPAPAQVPQSLYLLQSQSFDFQPSETYFALLLLKNFCSDHEFVFEATEFCYLICTLSNRKVTEVINFLTAVKLCSFECETLIGAEDNFKM